MSKLKFIFDRLFDRRHQVQIHLPAYGRSAFVFGVTKAGRKSALTEKIDAAGARPGETVTIDVHGSAHIVGRNPEIAVDNCKQPIQGK